PHLQTHRVARDLGLRHGAPERAARKRRRSGALHRLCLRSGHRPAGDAPVWGERLAPLLRERPAFPAAVRELRRMKAPYSWLTEWVKIPWGAPELGTRLTMAGIEMEALTLAAPPFSGVVVAEILAAESHPQADKLRVCRVSTGSGPPLQIVCGASNARAEIGRASCRERGVHDVVACRVDIAT